MNLFIQKTFRETVQKSLKELKITNQKNNRGQQSRAEEDPNPHGPTKPDLCIFEFQRQGLCKHGQNCKSSHEINRKKFVYKYKLKN